MPSENSRTLRVLIAEDDLLMRWSLGQVLTAGGARVTEAIDGREALAAVRAVPFCFDVAVLDVHLPDSCGLGLLASVRQLSPATRVILMTAFGTSDLRTGAQALGAEGVVDKPFDLDLMRALVLGPATA
jgi:two-component system response regulator FlrC